MKETFVVDPVVSNRANLIHQLSTFDSNLLMQYPNLLEAQNSLLSATNPPELIFVSLNVEIQQISDFLEVLRTKSDDTSVIVIGDNVTINDMRTLVQMGVDQILVRPFNANQLKEKIASAKNFRMQINRENIMKPKSSHFKVIVDPLTDRFTKITLSGWLAENANLPELKATQKDSALFIDCDRLRGINSIGIRSWILWLKLLMANGYMRFELENLRSNFLQQAALVVGILPDSAHVNSFYLRYWSQAICVEKEFKIARGKNYASDQMVIPKFQEEMINYEKVIYELDEPIERLLRFYKGKILIKG